MPNPEEVQQRRIEVMDTDWVFRDVVAVVIRGAVGGTALDACAKHKHREAPWMVIAAILIHRKRTLRVDRTAKLAAPDDNRVFKQPALLEVLNECPGRLVGVAHLALNRTWQAAVVVPAHVETLHHAGSTLAQTTRQQTVLGKASRTMNIRAVAL